MTVAQYYTNHQSKS